MVVRAYCEASEGIFGHFAVELQRVKEISVRINTGWDDLVCFDILFQRQVFTTWKKDKGRNTHQ
jgi:hypothetical protein